MSFLRYALVTVPAVVLLGSLSGSLAGAGVGNAWFAALARPGYTPPDWGFALAWMIFYALIGLSLATVLHARGAQRRQRALLLFALLVALSLAWPLAVFAWHRLDIALTLIAAMLGGTVALILIVWRIRVVAGLLLYPCLAWLMFVGLLTYQISTLNPDAGMLAPRAGSTDILL